MKMMMMTIIMMLMMIEVEIYDSNDAVLAVSFFLTSFNVIFRLCLRIGDEDVCY